MNIGMWSRCSAASNSPRFWARAMSPLFLQLLWRRSASCYPSTGVHLPDADVATAPERSLWPACDMRGAFGQVPMHRPDRHRALADGLGDALDGLVAYVAHCEHTRQAGLERQRRAGERPCLRGNIVARQDEAAVVPLEDIAQPLGARLGPDQDEHRRGGRHLPLSGPGIFQDQALQAVLSPAVDHACLEADLDVWGGLDLFDQVVGHAGRE